MGVYSVRVEREGFKPALLNNVNVNAGLNARGDVTLEVGASQQVVEVQAQAAALQTEDAKAATTITNKLVDELPLVVGGALRSPFDLATLTPEAKNFGDNNFALGGGQSASYGTNLDGVSANTTRALTASWVAVNTPSVEAITEFTVESNGFKAEYGHAGGGMMSFASKSGTNNFHGNVYEFLAQRRARRESLLLECSEPKESGLQAERFRRHGRRSRLDSEDLQRKKQDILLLFVRRIPKPQGRDRDFGDGAHAGNVQRRLLEVGGRRRPQIPIYDPATTRADQLEPHGICARRVSRERHPQRPLRPGCFEGPQRISERWLDADAQSARLLPVRAPTCDRTI